jgi:hypothetical protein
MDVRGRGRERDVLDVQPVADETRVLAQTKHCCARRVRLARPLQRQGEHRSEARCRGARQLPADRAGGEGTRVHVDVERAGVAEDRTDERPRRVRAAAGHARCVRRLQWNDHRARRPQIPMMDVRRRGRRKILGRITRSYAGQAAGGFHDGLTAHAAGNPSLCFRRTGECLALKPGRVAAWGGSGGLALLLPAPPHARRISRGGVPQR